jgi:hypothetical protein
MAAHDPRRTTYRSITFVRPHRVVRSPEDTVTVWRARGRNNAVMAVTWLVLALVFARTGEGGAPVILALVAAVLFGLVVVKAAILVRRARSELSS